MRRRRALAAISALLLVTTACDIPRDPEGTLKEITGGKMRVGVSESDPWVVLEGSEPAGVEVEIVKLFAEELEAEIEWIEGSEEELADAIEMRTLDLAIGGFTSTNMWSSKITWTHPYLTSQIVVAVPAGHPVDEDITGLEVAVEKGTGAAGILEKTDADVVLVDDVTKVEGPRAIESYLLDDFDLDDTGVRLQEADHVMGVPHGENAWLVKLERFLLTNTAEIDRILEAEDM